MLVFSLAERRSLGIEAPFTGSTEQKEPIKTGEHQVLMQGASQPSPSKDLVPPALLSRPAGKPT